MSIPLKLIVFLLIQTAGTLIAVGGYYAVLEHEIRSYHRVFTILTNDARLLHRRLDKPTPFEGPDRELLVSFTGAVDAAATALTSGGEVRSIRCKPVPPELRDLFSQLMRLWKPARRELANAAGSSAQDERAARKKLHDVFPPWQAELERMERSVMYREGTIRTKMTNTVLIVGGFNLVFLCIVVWLVRKFITEPLQAVESAAARVADGDYSMVAPVFGKDEISSLAAEFNRMSTRLQQTIGALRESESKLVEKANTLAHANRELEQYSYAAAHDLQEPLRVVSLYVQLLNRRYELPPDAVQLTSQIRTGAERMQRLVSDLLVHSRSVHEPPQSGPADPNRAVADAIELLQDAITETGAVVHRDPMPAVIADQADLEIVCRNLIANALKYCGDRAPHVEISSVVENSVCTISVRDRGIGIAPEYHERIFGLFKRLHGRDVPGTGVGLSVARKVVEKHGGRIWVESEPGQGATFRFQLPVAAGAVVGTSA